MYHLLPCNKKIEGLYLRLCETMDEGGITILNLKFDHLRSTQTNLNWILQWERENAKEYRKFAPENSPLHQFYTPTLKQGYQGRLAVILKKQSF